MADDASAHPNGGDRSSHGSDNAEIALAHIAGWFDTLDRDRPRESDWTEFDQVIATFRAEIQAVSSHQSKEAVAWLYMSQLCTTAATHGIDLTALHRIQRYALRQPGTAEAPDVGQLASEEQGFDDSTNNASPDASDTDSSSDDEVRVVDGFLVARHAPRSTYPQTATSSTQGAQTPWDQAILAAGLMPSGVGRSPNSATIVGGHGYEDALFHALDLPLTANCNVSTANNRQSSLAKVLQHMVWQSKTPRPEWLKLHPWAVKCWVLQLTSRILSNDGLERLDAIITASHQAGATASNYTSIHHHSPSGVGLTSNSVVSMMFQSLTNVLQLECLQRNPYVDFLIRVAQFDLHTKVEALIAACASSSETQVRRTVVSMVFGDSTIEVRGVSARTLVGKFIRLCMEWNERQYYEKVHAIRTPARLVEHYGLAFCLFIDTEFVTMSQTNGWPCTGEMVGVIDTVFPEFHNIMDVLCQHLVPPLISRNPRARLQLTTPLSGPVRGHRDTLRRRIIEVAM